jgi:hypothetical protein
VLLVGLLVVGLVLVDRLVGRAQIARLAQQHADEVRRHQVAYEAVCQLFQLHDSIAELVELATQEPKASRIRYLAWEVMQRHKAACERALVQYKECRRLHGEWKCLRSCS